MVRPFTYKIKEVLLSSPETKRSLMGLYSNYKEIETQLIPHHLSFSLKSRIPSSIEMKYNKFSIGKSVTFPFKISSKYVQIKK